MPESPEVQALAEFFDERMAGRSIRTFEVVDVRAYKTRGVDPASITGSTVARVGRFGKLVDLDLGERQLVVSFGRHGWATWREADAGDHAAADGPPVIGRVRLGDGSGFDLTDAGSFRSAGMWIVASPAEVPAVAKLGPDPAADGFTREDFDAAFAGRRKQVKAILQDQGSLAGIGNAYSDEILHAAKISPVVHAAALDDAQLDRLFETTTDVIRSAIAARRGIPIDLLKATKVAAMSVHGRAGQTCPVCGGTIRDFSFASTTAQYCPTCQTDGALL
jgi:formamidopyrimidine-DNA glycosylase